MKYIRIQWSNLLFVLVLVLLLFTPVGTYVKVKLNQAKLWFVNPSTIEIAKRESISNFNWNLVDNEGKQINFQQMEGEVVLVNFWATWCPPCIAEMPSLQELYADYGKRIKFLFVANDQPQKVSSFLKENGYNLPVYYAKSEVPKELYSRSIPATFLIDDQGNIVMKEIGSSNWNSQNVRKQIDELIAFSLAE
ncbi:TlpA family protein disulfide reductase [Kordia zhangzhouensis]|uniref:TlpA family protein disulfide reductase n=1 Tax=Kordia zhangzhouensis TaxID=1620405 RepID=UPI000629387A|nr:TlpA disulfide reductase family protein [Kordia zhangzhouensis]